MRWCNVEGKLSDLKELFGRTIRTPEGGIATTAGPGLAEVIRQQQAEVEAEKANEAKREPQTDKPDAATADG
jgi:hypothetical protein